MVESDGAVRIFDSTIILEYLDDAYPDPPMRPASAPERARVRMLEEVMDTHFEAINWGLSEIRWFRRAVGGNCGFQIDDAGIAVATFDLRQRVSPDIVEGHGPRNRTGVPFRKTDVIER